MIHDSFFCGKDIETMKVSNIYGTVSIYHDVYQKISLNHISSITVIRFILKLVLVSAPLKQLVHTVTSLQSPRTIEESIAFMCICIHTICNKTST